MAKRSLIQQLDEALEAILANPNAFPSVVDPELAVLLSIAADLRYMPTEEFRAQLKASLLRAAKSSIQKGEESMTTAVQQKNIAVPYLSVRNAAAAIEFYKNAFGAEEIIRLEEPDGRIGHAEIRIGDAAIMLADEYPEYGIVGPQTLGGSGFSIHLTVDDAQAFAERAAAAGAKILRPVKDEFYGERSGKIQDPFGHTWFLSQHIEDVSAEEMQKRYDEIVKSAEESGQPLHPPPYIPAGLHNLTPYLHTRGAAHLINFMKKAFDGQEYDRTEMPDGTILHAKVRIGASVIELGEAHGEFQPMPGAFHLYVKDADVAYKRALEAGATSMLEPSNQFYGDREASVKDPSGNHWYLATHVEDVTPEEMKKREEEVFGKLPSEKKKARVKPVPEGFHTVTPYLMVRQAEELLDFVKAAFNATEISRTIGSAGGLHAEISIGNSRVMIGGSTKIPIDETRTTLYLYVEDVDKIYEQAVKAGGISMQEPTDQPYGDRNAQVKDPFGNSWYIATHIKDVEL